MKINYNEYKEKVYGCWIGKNIGGTMGTPYEGCKEMQDIKGFVTAENVVLPNDDLDLQLVWLHAMEKLGPYSLDAAKLGEFWLSFITPYWNEYGTGKGNLASGLVPPLSGTFENTWSDSNGAWIRTEIWATLCPGCPDGAARYAIEDAMVDHGNGEGTYAAAFVAAMQSAAFVEQDIRKIINVGLSRIPDDSRVAKSIKFLFECYDGGMTAVETRNAIQKLNSDIGDGWFEAPSNVAYTVLGLLYGEGDFKKSMITAINCGDDTDCTGATVGATLGILYGIKGIPDDWRKHLGDNIVTVSIGRGTLYGVPETCTALTERVADLAPSVIKANNGMLRITEGMTEIPENAYDTMMNGEWNPTLQRLSLLKGYSFETDFTTLKAVTEYESEAGIRIKPNESSKIKITFINNVDAFGSIPYFLEFRWLCPDGMKVEGPSSLHLPHINRHDNGRAEAEFTVTAGENVQPMMRAVLEVTAKGRSFAGYIPVIFVG